MKPSAFKTSLALLVFFSGACLFANNKPYIIANHHSPHTQLKPVPLDEVQWTSGFWADRYRQLCDVTLAESWRLLADIKMGHVLENFRIAAGESPRKYAGTSWQDEWLYKWIEAAACVWRVNKNNWLEERMEEGIALIAAAQQPDGYISTFITARNARRFTEPREHEIYNMGHLITAGVIHRRMTGKTNLYDIAVRAADFLCKNVGVTVEPHFAHNPSALMGLVELYRDSGERRYLECARLIVDSRGKNPKKLPLLKMTPGIAGTDMIQDRVPVRESSEVVGHNVFFTYLYTGAEDILAEIGDDSLKNALDRLWTDMTTRKMFINGGVSVAAQGISNNAPVVEGAGKPYEFPHSTCYNETCGQIGCFMWGHRMLMRDPDGAHADIMEREMYNGFLGCIGLEGKSWFYRNILRRYEKDYKPTGGTDMARRNQPAKNQICCPSNLLRTFAQLGACFYSVDTEGVWVHHFGGSKANISLPSGGKFTFEQITDYPWNGSVVLKMNAGTEKPVAVRVRIPEWAHGVENTVLLNGNKISATVKRGYMTVSRKWRANDTLSLTLPMEPRLLGADPRSESTRNQAAVMRGPVLYCVESPDLPEQVEVRSVYIPTNIKLKVARGIGGTVETLAKNAIILGGKAYHRPEPLGELPLYRDFDTGGFTEFDLKLIPYYAWANRGKSAMSVWIPVLHEN